MTDDADAAAGAVDADRASASEEPSSTRATEPGPAAFETAAAPSAFLDAEPVDAVDPADRSSRGGRPGSRGRRRLAKPLVTVLVLLGLVALPVLVGLGWFWYEVSPPGGRGQAVTVRVDSGWSVPRIGDALESHGVVGSSLAFQAYVRLTHKGPFRAGTYELHRNSGARRAAAVLARGPVVLEYSLVVAPGLTLDQVASRVGAIPGLHADRFLAAASSGRVRSQFQPPGSTSLEGLLGPDTYEVARGESETAVLHTLVSAFDAHARADGLAGPGPASLGVSPYQEVTVASLVQREAGLEVDRPLIAAVIYNRLHDGMKLQIDATVQYARGPKDGPLTSADFALDSPYNTYVVKGLPPTPISTVSDASLRAAVAPAAVPYLYYVLIDRSGKHAFATTYAQHLANIARARKNGVLP